MLELTITALAAGGDGVARDAEGRVTFVPRTAPGDRIRARLVRQTRSFARAELVEVLAAAPARVSPPCGYFEQGCGGCDWQHVDRAAQLEAKQALVAGALRNLDGLELVPIADPAPAYGWRRRARFHVVGGKVGLYAAGSHRLITIDATGGSAPRPTGEAGGAPTPRRLASLVERVQAAVDRAPAGARCPQLEPGLDAALAAVAAASPPDGELALVRGHRGDVAVGVQRPWRGAARLVGRASIRGVIAGDARHGEPVIELEPGLFAGPWDFAQASAAGNARLVALVRAALGPGPGRLLELHAGGGNLTRGFVADGWDVVASDAAPPARPPAGVRFEVGPAERVLATLDGGFHAAVLDPPRTGAPEVIEPLARLRPGAIVYVSCDPATLARDAGRLIAAGYRAERAWPVDLMPQTAHVEVVLRLVRAS